MVYHLSPLFIPFTTTIIIITLYYKDIANFTTNNTPLTQNTHTVTHTYLPISI